MVKNMNIICPVCGKELIKKDKEYKCNNNHTFDISKNGYINLLLNSRNSGDNKEMVKSRRLFLEKGYYSELVKNIISILKQLNINNILDVGCGEGYYDREILKEIKTEITGIDISKEACLYASKKCNDVNYIVSSTNHLPFPNNEFDLLLNIFAPHNEEEFTRICNKYILKVIPGMNHLLELKQLIYDDVIIKPEKKLSFESFKEIKCVNINYKVNVDDLLELLQMTPYFYKSKYDIDILKNNSNKLITCNFILLLYKKITN